MFERHVEVLVIDIEGLMHDHAFLRTRHFGADTNALEYIADNG